MPGTISRDQAIATGMATIRAVWQDHFGTPPLEATVEALAAQVMHESLFGRNVAGFTRLEAGTFNYGSYQATAGFRSAHAHDLGYGEISYTDRHLSGQQYPANLRVYPTQRSAATDWLAKIAQCFGGWNSLEAAEPLDPEKIGTALGADANGKFCYAETPIAEYVAAVQGHMAEVQAVAAQGIPAENIDAPLGDDFPPDAPRRLVMYVGTLPVQGGAWNSQFAPKPAAPVVGGSSPSSSAQGPDTSPGALPGGGEVPYEDGDDPCDDSEDGTS
jgi:hypothetical protein